MSSEPALSGEPPCPSVTADPTLGAEHANTTTTTHQIISAVRTVDNTSTNRSNNNNNNNSDAHNPQEREGDDDFMFATGDAIGLMVEPPPPHQDANEVLMPGPHVRRRRAPSNGANSSEDEIQSDDGEYDRRGGEHGALLPKLSGALVDSNSSQLQHYLLPGGTSAPSLPDQLVRSAFRQLGRSDNDFSIASQPVAGDVLTTPQAAATGAHATAAAGRLQPSAFSDAADSSMAALSPQQHNHTQHNTRQVDVAASNAARHSFSASSLSLSQALAGNGSAGAASQSKTPNGSEPLKIRNVYVAALPVNFTESDLSELLSQFGKLKSCRMFNEAGRVAEIGRAYGFALFEDAAAAEAAVAALDGKPFRNARLQCQLSRNGVVKKPKDRRERARIEAANSVAQLRQSQRQHGTPDGTPSDGAGRSDGSPTDLARSADAATPQLSPPCGTTTPGIGPGGSYRVSPSPAHVAGSGSDSSKGPPAKEAHATDPPTAADEAVSEHPQQAPAVGLAGSPIGIKIPLPVTTSRASGGGGAANRRPAPSPHGAAAGGAGAGGGATDDSVAARLASAMATSVAQQQQASGGAAGVASVRVGFKPPPLPPTEQFSRVNLPGNLWSALAAAQQRDVELHRLQQQHQQQQQQQQQTPSQATPHQEKPGLDGGNRQASSSEVAATTVPLSASAPPVPTPSAPPQHATPATSNSTTATISTYSPAQSHQTQQAYQQYRPVGSFSGIPQQHTSSGASLQHAFTLSPLPSNGGSAGSNGLFGIALPPMAGANFAPLPPPHQQATAPSSTTNPTPPHSGYAGYHHHPPAAPTHAAPPSPLPPSGGGGLAALPPPFGGSLASHHYSAQHQRVVLPPSLAAQHPYHHPQYHQQHHQHVSPSALASPMVMMGAPWMAANPLPFQAPFGFPPSS